MTNRLLFSVFALACATSQGVFAQGAPAAAGPPVAAQAAPSVQAAAEAQRRSMEAVRMGDGEDIVLDGKLDEPVWQRAVPAKDFVQQDPDNGKPATEPTEVRIVYGKTALYMGVTCFDSEPGKWLGYQRRRDEFLQADDRFMWNIDTYQNAQYAYFFEMNPSGLMGDALRGPGFQNRAWDGIWNAKVERSEIGWTIEVEIPFATLNFDPTKTSWGINFQRTVRRKNEESVWMGWARNQGLNRLTNAGTLNNMRDLSQGIGLDIKPYGLFAVRSSPGRVNTKTDTDVDAGLDVFYNLTPSLRANLTVNTDFAQTEVDQRLVNLTRFPLFFPEKRDFFLDGATFFDFQSTAQGGNTLLPYFSRRIGLDANGNPQKIDVGGKLAGQYGRNDIGVLYVKTGEDGAAPSEDFTVVRLKRRALRQSYFGVLYTGRNSSLAGRQTRHTVGADFLLATSSFLGSDNLSLGGFLVRTTNPLDTGKSSAYGFVLDYPNDPLSASLLYREVQENYVADVGFTPRVGYRRITPDVEFTPRPRNHPWIRRFVFGTEANVYVSTIDNSLLNRDFDINAFQVDLHSQDSFQFHLLPTYERLERNFAISPRITLPRGREYSFMRYRFQFSMAQRRKVALAPTVEMGDFYSGTRTRLALDMNIRVRPGIIIYTSSEYNKVDLAEGRFHTRLFRVVPELQFSPWLAWVNNVQYDTQSAVVGWQSRFRWILKPGNDLYFVYTHNWLDDPLDNRFETLDRRLSSKFLYTLRF